MAGLLDTRRSGALPGLYRTVPDVGAVSDAEMIVIESNAAEVAKSLDISTRQLRVVMRDALEEVGKRIVKDYQRTTRTWDHKPQFLTEVNTSRNQYEVMVGTDDEIFGFVDRGTRVGKSRYPITPKRAKALRFWSESRPKTTPGHIGSGAGGKGGELQFRQLVMHPGIKPRRFTEQIQKKASKYARAIIEKRLSQWTSKNR